MKLTRPFSESVVERLKVDENFWDALHTELAEIKAEIALGDADIEAGRLTTYSSAEELTNDVMKNGQSVKKEFIDYNNTYLMIDVKTEDEIGEDLWRTHFCHVDECLSQLTEKQQLGFINVLAEYFQKKPTEWVKDNDNNPYPLSWTHMSKKLQNYILKIFKACA